MICVTRVAKSSLEKALAENPEIESILVTGPQLPLTNGSTTSELHEPLVIRVDPSDEDHNS